VRKGEPTGSWAVGHIRESARQQSTLLDENLAPVSIGVLMARLASNTSFISTNRLRPATKERMREFEIELTSCPLTYLDVLRAKKWQMRVP
jgi:hypothetical protein